MRNIHKLFCIIGRSAVGKSTITREAAEKLGLSILKSYTSREMRTDETEETSDHIHISQEEVEKYRNDMVAYTERVGYCSFATRNQIMNSDFYIINPSGFYELKLKTKDMDIELVPVYITVPYSINLANAKNRGDADTWKKNYDAESEEFSDFEKSNMIYYRVLNSTTIGEAVEKLLRIVEKERPDA